MNNQDWECLNPPKPGRVRVRVSMSALADNEEMSDFLHSECLSFMLLREHYGEDSIACYDFPTSRREEIYGELEGNGIRVL